MAKKQTRENKKRLVVSIRHVAAPEADVRLSRAIQILLMAARNNSQPTEKESPLRNQ